MLGIDVTLQSINTVDECLFSAALAIEFMNLQMAYISLNHTDLYTSHTPLNVSSFDDLDFGRGTFAILEANNDIIDSVMDSKISLKVSLLCHGKESSISEYSNGVLDDLKRKESLVDNYADSFMVAASNKIFQQKTKVFGESAIIAFHPSITVEMVHSIGVGSIAGNVVLSIAIVDISKVSEYKKIAATGRIIADLCEIQTPYEDFNMDSFLDNNLIVESNMQDIVEIVISEESEGDSDSEESVSIDDLLPFFTRRTEENEKIIIPKVEKEEIAPFHYKEVDRNKSRDKHIYDAANKVSHSRDGNWPPIVITQNGVRILGVQERKSDCSNKIHDKYKGSFERKSGINLDDSGISYNDRDQKGAIDPFESLEGTQFQQKFQKSVVSVLLTKSENEKLMLLAEKERTKNVINL